MGLFSAEKIPVPAVPERKQHTEAGKLLIRSVEGETPDLAA